MSRYRSAFEDPNDPDEDVETFAADFASDLPDNPEFDVDPDDDSH